MSRDDALHAEQMADQLLHDVRREVKPTRADAARNFAGVEARLGLALGGASSLRLEGHTSAAGTDEAPREPSLGELGRTAGTRAAGVAGHGLQLAVKGALVAAFGLVTGFGGYLLGRTDSAAHRDPSALDTPLPIAEAIAPVTVVAPAELPAAAASAQARRSPRPISPVVTRASSASAHERNTHRAKPEASLLPAAAPAPSNGAQGPGLHEALELLGRAEAAVRRSDGLEARLWLSDLDRRVAHEVLLEERLVTATLASCALGDAPEAQRTLRELTQANPASMYRARLEGSCVKDFVSGGDSKISTATH